MICRRVGGRAGGWVGPTGTGTGRFQPDYPFPPTFPLAEIEKDFLQDKAFFCCKTLNARNYCDETRLSDFTFTLVSAFLKTATFS